jgi:hypothetical protein
MADNDKNTTIDWKAVWETALKDKELFPIKAMNKNTVSISCPTRFSNAGELSINITPSFNDESIVLELLVFNDNLELSDLPKADDGNSSKDNKFNQLVSRLVQYELSNRVMERFKIKSSGFESNEEAEDALVDYINNKATESGRMFDDKLDELNDIADSKKENYIRVIESIRDSRAFLLKKVESILDNYYGWKAPKNEDYSDSTMSCYDDNGNLMAVVTLADKCIIVDLAKDITAKVSAMQSDEEIESELVDDIDNAQSVLADRELNQLKDVVASNNEPEPNDPIDDEADYLESLERRLTKLESMYIRRRLRKF